MTDSLSPHEVLNLLLQEISKGHWNQLHLLYAEDAVVEQPFALPRPVRLEGRAAIERHFATAGSGGLSLCASDVVVHQSSDPELIIAEYTYNGRVAATGHEFRTANIQLLRVRDGLIIASCDYHNHVALAAAVGQLPRVFSALTDNDAPE
jgi:ketosteroid isomerase-like protein